MNAAPRTIVVAGGGPVGLSLAALLASGQYREHVHIRLLEPHQPARWDPHQLDLRVFALSRASQRILGTLGVWSGIVTARACPYRRMFVWEGSLAQELGALQFDSAEVGEPDLGHIVEDCLVRERLTGVLAGFANVTLSFGVGVDSLRSAERLIEVQTSAGEVIPATLLIAADGSGSAVRSLLGLPISEISYGQHAVVTHISTERPHQDTAWQRFLPGGPLAFLPLLDGRSSVVWSVPSEHARRLLDESPEAFALELAAASGGVLGTIESVAGRASFPLQALHARHYCCPRVALVGDAAHTVHPLAGQGMNLGLLDAAALADVVAVALGDGQDPGDVRFLRRYERARKGENIKMLLALDAMHRLFGLTGPLMASIRALGLSAVNAAPPAKRLLMREALGIRGELPGAARAHIARAQTHRSREGGRL